MARRRLKAQRAQSFQGTIQHHGKFAFLISEDPRKADIYLRGPSLRLAMDGDRVLVRLRRDRGGRVVGEVVYVLERKRKTVVGILRRELKRWMAFPEQGEGVRVLSSAPGLKPEAGRLAVVRLTHWPTQEESAAGTLVEVLGRPEAPGVRASAVLRERELPESFSEAALRESRDLPDRVPKTAWRGRMELFDLPVFTIDGADAKDFDDAVSIEPQGRSCLRLGVHIADVSHYVRPGTALDREAFRRATSVYLPDRTVPMLPPKLSEGLCSLMPHAERLTLSCFLDLDERGRVLGCRLAESVIRSCHRFTYEEVERILLGARPGRLPKAVAGAIGSMGELAKRLTAARVRRGALDFDLPEYKVEVDARGAPVGVSRRERLDSHRLIEEFMILANEAVARYLLGCGEPSLHRVHEDPDPAKLEALAHEVSRLGVRPPADLAAPAGGGLAELLRRVSGHPLEETITVLAVRSLKMAVYSAVPGRHFGLASKAYTHFTSPIRRYPDLLVHRAVKRTMRGKVRSRRAASGDAGVDLARAATHCSQRERLAAEAERRAVDILRVELLKREVGRVYSGTVSRVLPQGALVELDGSGARGLAAEMSERVGARVRVRIAKVDLGKAQIDLKPASGGRPEAPRRGKKKKR
ncbi:MAG: VacB/RNase II family 3'-5' exoribonuclease [Elusimicrobiota bacterium]